MLSVAGEQIIEEAQNSDIATQSQLVLVLRYNDDKHSMQERSLEFIPLQSATSESIATALRECLAAIAPEDQKSKLFCVMRGATAGVQRKIKYVSSEVVLYVQVEICFEMPFYNSSLLMMNHPHFS